MRLAKKTARGGAGAGCVERRVGRDGTRRRETSRRTSRKNGAKLQRKHLLAVRSDSREKRKRQQRYGTNNICQKPWTLMCSPYSIPLAVVDRRPANTPGDDPMVRRSNARGSHWRRLTQDVNVRWARTQAAKSHRATVPKGERTYQAGAAVGQVGHHRGSESCVADGGNKTRKPPGEC